MSFSGGGLGQVSELASVGTSAVTSLVNGVFHVSGSGYPKPAPPPLDTTVAQVVTMLQKDPTTLANLIKHIRGASPVDVRRVNAGQIPTVAELQSNLTLTATVGLALANAQNAPNHNISIGEANVRAVIQQGLLNYQMTSGSSTGVIPGTNIPMPQAKTVQSAVPIIAGVGILGALLFARSRSRR